ncbi:MAG: 3-hydroxyacyl-CoA dehydrogenase family protein, partial [Microbacterium sp.]
MPVTARSVAVIGGGLMGRGISARLALRGLDVAVVEPDIATAALVRDEAVVGRRLATLEGAVTDADIVIEAITEHAPTKRNVWRRVSATARPDAVLATNTSSLSIDDLAREVAFPERFAGMHWFTPADLIPCVEIVRGAVTSDETIAALTALAQGAGKAPVVVADSPGFVANRLQFALLAEALRCVEEGIATPAQIDE